MATAMRYEHFDVDIASSARAGLKLLHERRYDVVVLDRVLAGSDFGSRLRANGNSSPLVPDLHGQGQSSQP